ncbi:M14 family metallopeptidase [Cohnella rhizosphaerae]|uniref:M14 family metallopeptidase n=1 Tax=Cohnella rhizosphaerae TaxID=1457232 RepID=UPI003B8A7E98
METILRLYERLAPEELAGSLVMLPIANPYAYRAGTRISPDDDMNLARVFPGKPDGTVTERLACTLHDLIAGSDFFLDLHSGGTHYAVAALAGYYHDPDSAFGRRCRAAAEAFGSPPAMGARADRAGQKRIVGPVARGSLAVYRSVRRAQNPAGGRGSVLQGDLASHEPSRDARPSESFRAWAGAGDDTHDPWRRQLRRIGRRRRGRFFYTGRYAADGAPDRRSHRHDPFLWRRSAR